MGNCVSTHHLQGHQLAKYKLKQRGAHADLAQKLRHSDVQMSGLKDDLQQKDADLHTEKDKTTELEDAVLENRLKHQLDLKEIWRLVHKEIEHECLSDGSQELLEQDKPISVSAHSVRNHVAKEILTLRSQLARSEATLAALTKKGLPLCLSKTTDRNYDWKNNNDRHSPSSPLVEALTLGSFDGNQNSIRRGQGSSSADDILDAHDSGNDLRSENAQSLARSCPSLAHKLVTSGTQTEDAFQKCRPPQIGASKFTVTNTSTGSSTSGAVDLDVSSSSLHSDIVHVHSTKPKRKDHCKTVQIVETACTPESPSSPTSLDSAWLGRTSSFKRAIERGQSQDSSNQSFETCDPPSTSPDVSPERLELPPYPGPSRSTPMLKDSWVVLTDPYPQVQIPEPTEICVANARTHLTPHSLTPNYASYGSFQSNSLSESLPSWDYFTPSQKDIYYTGPPPHPDDMEEKVEESTNEAAPSTTDSLAPVDDRQSPNLNRRLSTLVEEGSDAEAEESLTAGSATCGRIEELPDYKPPLYKAPPAYEQALARKEGQSPKLDPRCKSRQLSPHAGRVANQSPQRAQSRDSSPRTGTPQRERSLSPQPPPRKSNMTAAGVTSRELAMAMAAEVIQRPSSPVCHSPRPEAQATPDHRMSRSKRRVGIMHEPPNSQQQVNKEGQLIDLVYGDLEEVELSEADKLLNSQLLEEAKKAAKSKTRRRKGSGSSPDLARTLSFDEGCAEEEVDAFESSPCMSRTHKIPEQLQLSSPPKSPRGSCGSRTPPRSPRLKEDLDSEVDVKKEILQGLNQKAEKPQGDFTHPRPFRITAKNTQLAKLREENLAKKRGQMKQVKMPELSETSETESGKGTCSGGSMDSAESETSSDRTQNEHLPPAASQNAVCFPSLPEAYLKKIGLHRRKGSQSDKCPDQLTEQEVEEKFASLALAFKTDKLTLDKRIELQERARDIAEQNIDREIQGLKEAMKVLSQYCAAAESRDVYSKIQHHIEVLEQSTVRVSSRAELHGAVQQEFRMSNAIDVMVQHVENLKRIYEKEHGELEETKKILQDNNMIISEAPDVGMLQKRSYSIASAAGAFKTSGTPTQQWQVQQHQSTSVVTNPHSKPPVATTKAGRRRASVAVVSGRGGQPSTASK